MRLLGPNVQKLMAAQDVAGLRAALRYPDTEVRRDAARALGWIELPPSATERHYLQYRWVGIGSGPGRGSSCRRWPADGGGSFPRRRWRIWRRAGAEGELSKLLVEAAVEAMARIGGPAGVEAVIRSIAELEAAPRRSGASTSTSYFCKLGVDELIGILNDEARPRGSASDRVHGAEYTVPES